MDLGCGRGTLVEASSLPEYPDHSTPWFWKDDELKAAGSFQSPTGATVLLLTGQAQQEALHRSSGAGATILAVAGCWIGC